MTKRSEEQASGSDIADHATWVNDRLTMTEAARLKGVSYHTVSRAVRKGRLPVVRLGRMALISAPDLQDWHPMRERAPIKYRRQAALDDDHNSSVSLISADHVDLAIRLSSLYEVIHSAANEGSLESLAQIATERVADAFHLTRMTLWRINLANDSAHRLAVVREPLSNLPETVQLDDAPFLRALVGDHHARIVDVPRGLNRGAPKEVPAMPKGPLLVVPLVRKDRVVGLMFGDRNDGRIDFTAEQLALADGIANQMAMAIDNAMLREGERQRRVQLEAILGELSGAVSAFDEHGRLTLSNAAERKLFDLSGEEARPGQLMNDYLGVKRTEYLDGSPVKLEDDPATRAIRGERTQNQEARVIRKDGARRYISTNSRPIMVDDRIVGAVSVSTDITARHASERQEKLRLKQLERAAARAQAVADLVVEINAGQDAHTVSETALQRLALEVGADAGVVMLRDASGKFHPGATYGERRYAFPEEGLDLLNSPMTSNAFSRYRPIVVPSQTVQLPQEMGGTYRDEGSVMIIPMQIRGQRVGVAYLGFSDVPTLDKSDLTYGAIWGRQCAQAIDKATLVEQLEFAHGRLMAIIDQLAQAVLILDAPGGEVVISNQAAERLWDRRLDDVRVPAAELPVIDSDGYALVGDEHPFLRPLRTRQETVGEPLTVVRPDGSHVEVLASHSPVFDGRGAIVGSVSVLQNRADFKPLDRAKDEFISVVAHELRNPLTSLRGNLQLLQRRFRKRMDDEVDRDIERIDSVITQVDRIADLVSRMLDVSRVDLGSLDVSVDETDAGVLVRSVVTEAKGLNPDRSIILQAPESLPVVWDAARVQQVLANLMQNAARYAPEGDVEVDLAALEGDRIRISVRDHGSGVPAAIRKRLFRQYHRFDDGQDARGFAANGVHGLGIGLYISARLARAHGGSLKVDNAKGGGAIFTLELPKDASSGD